MPKISINEIDQSRYIAPGNNVPVVVLIPGTASFGPEFTADNPQVSTYVGANDLSAFYSLYGLTPATITNNGKISTLAGDVSFDYVTNLLNKGATVKFYRLNTGSYAQSKSIGDTKISAKYTGKLGNYLTVAVKPVNVVNKSTGETSKDLVVEVYRTSIANNNKTEIDLANLNKFNRVETYRVSDDVNSNYYDNLNNFDYIQLTASDVTAILSELNDKTEFTCYPLFGALDFANASEDGQISELAAEDALSDIVQKLNDSFINYADPYLFDFDFIVSGGFVNSDKDDYAKIETTHKSMIDLAEKRGDAVALLDTPHDMTDQDVSDYSSKINTSYAAIYAPWASVVSAATGRTVMMPPSFNFIMAILYGMTNSSVENQLWYVPAGVTRASAPFIVNPKYEIGSVILNKFQNDNPWRVNPIMRVRNYGYCIYGNATCQQSVSGAPNSALESMNVRLLANVVKKTIFAVCCGLSFEYNDSRLWTKFYAQMDVVLTYMKRHFGLYDYKIIMDTTTVTAKAMNERRVPGKIKISPQLAGEFFDIDFEIAPSGVTFNEEAAE